MVPGWNIGHFTQAFVEGLNGRSIELTGQKAEFLRASAPRKNTAYIIL